MSIIAESLKKLKQKQKSSYKAAVHYTDKKGIDVDVAIVVVCLFVAFISVGYTTFRLYRDTNRYTRMVADLPSIEVLNEKIKSKKKLLIKKPKNESCEYYLSLGKINKMFELAKEENNLKYQGIYYFVVKDYDKALKLLEGYLKKHSKDEEAIIYLAWIYYKQGMYGKALSTLNRIKNSNNYKVYFNKGAVYEKMGDIETAINLYKKALEKSDDKRLISRLKSKIVVLEILLRKKNGF